MQVECPLGDVVDRLSILAIKQARLPTPEARANATREAAALGEAWNGAGLPAIPSLAAWERLCAVNEALWEVEDLLRAHERSGAFDEAFIALARSVYRLNDTRSQLKRSINLDFGSTLIEEKSYLPPDREPTG